MIYPADVGVYTLLPRVIGGKLTAVDETEGAVVEIDATLIVTVS